MKSIKQLRRLLKIYATVVRYGLDRMIMTWDWFAPVCWMIYLNPCSWRRKAFTPGEALRKTLEDLGPVFVKFGQALSTRPDILSPDVAHELCKLHDQVPPFPVSHVLALIEKTFSRPAHDVFATFDEQPLASASIAQVHAATLHTGEDVVVKVLRPHIKQVIETDICLLYTCARFIERSWPEAQRFKLYDVVSEFEKSLLDELDLQREAANATQLRRHFKDSPLLYIPIIYWDYVRPQILVQERIYGIPVADIAQLKAHGIDLKKLATRGFEIFFTQVFRDCFFHADMHPGNIFVSPLHPHDPQYICIDFGIMGTLNDQDKRYLAENILAFLNRDYRRVAQLHVESGWVSSDTRVDEFESAVRTVCEPIFEKPLKDISFAFIMMRLFQVARRFHMQVQPQLILLQKTLLAVEGLGRQIDPELDLWLTAKPFLEKWMHEQLGPRAFLTHVRQNLPFFIEQLPYMPRLLNDVLLVTKEYKKHLLGQAQRPMPPAPRSRWMSFGAGMLAASLFWIYYTHFM